MSKSKILLVGGAGYIGSHVYIKLYEKGYEPLIFDNFCNSFEDKLSKLQKYLNKDINYFNGDILNKSDLKEVFALNNIKGVIHLAALKSVPDSDKDHIEYYKNNISGLINIIEQMATNNVKKMIFSSSATVYGDKAISPVDEGMITQSNNTYGLTKIIGEEIIKNLCRVDKEWSTISLRYFNPAGSSDIELLNEEPKNFGGNLFPLIQKCLDSKSNNTFNIFGNDYNTPDGTPMRDFIHVEDLADAHVLALNKIFIENNYQQTINVGSGSPKTVLEILKKFEEIASKKINICFKDRRENDIGSSYADIGLAARELGFSPNHDLDSICRSSLKV